MSGPFSQPRFQHTCCGLRLLALLILNIDASVLVLCLLTGYSEFVVDCVKILKEVGQFGEIPIFNSQHSLMLACLSVAVRQLLS